MLSEGFAPEIQKKVDHLVEKAIVIFLDKVSKENSLEEIIKTLITEKIFSKLGPKMNRYLVRKAAKKIVRKAVDRIWEKHRDNLSLKLQALK